MAQAANIANVQLWAKKDEDLKYTRIDLFPEEPIKLTLSVTNIMDPLATNSVYSRTFRVPNTQANNAFFKAVFNVNSVSFDASKKVSAYLNDSGSFYTNGNIRLTATYSNDREGNVEYEIVFMGETSDFASQIGGGFLSDVNLQEYNHDQSYTNIINSWNANIGGGIFGGDILYPLVNWGYTYSDGLPIQNTTSLYTGTTGGMKGFTNSGHPLSQSQMKPSIRAKALWDKIFAETEYTYESDFLESDFFKKMYILSEKQARAELTFGLTFEANNTAPQEWYYLTTQAQLYAPNEVSDPNGVWNPNTSIYTAQATSGTNYEFVLTYYHRVAPVIPFFTILTMSYPVQLVDADTGLILASVIRTADNSSSIPTFVNVTMNVALTQGQRVKFMVDPTPTVPPSGSASLVITNFIATQVSGPEIATISTIMPDNIRKIDFMRSIINRFKLVFVPSRDNEKHFKITPWKDWILQGNSYDWNTLLDTSKDIKSTPLFYGQNRFQVYADQEDSDFPNYTYQLQYKQTYGQLNLDSDNELLTGSITVKDQFAPTPIYPIGGAVPGAALNPGLAAKFLIPWISKADFTAVQNNPIQPKLRLVFYNGLQYVPGFPGTPLRWYLKDDLNVAQAQDFYPLVSEYSYWPVNDSTFDLSWQNIAPVYDTELAGNPLARTNYDTFNVYWKTWYDTNFDPYSRKVELTLILDYSQMINLEFNNYYWIKDSWYLINKVSDYIAGQTTACKVELIKVGNNIGLTIPATQGQGYPQGLCYTFADSTACDAYCCAQSELTGLWYSNTPDLETSNTLWQDSYKTNPADPGFYAGADGTVFEVGVGGYITAFYDGASCEPCISPVLTSFGSCCRGTSVCVACCCDGTTLNLWGDSNRIETCTHLYTNSTGTILAPDGWYTDPTNPAYAVQVISGTVWAIGVCSSCSCGGETPVYEKTAIYSLISETECHACTTGGIPTTVWLDTNDWATATTIYSSNSTESSVGAGYWRATDNDQVYQTDTHGIIVAIIDCTGCDAVYFVTARNCNESTLLQTFSSSVVLTAGKVVSSPLFPGQCWTVIAPASDGYPIDYIHDGCRSCAESWVCNCVEYLVTSSTKYPSYISYTDCSTGETAYQYIEGGLEYNICMCEDSLGVVSGIINSSVIGPCVTPPCYVWDLSVSSGPTAIIEYEECTTGVIKTLEMEAGGEYQICAVDESITVLSGSATYTKGSLCG
jgi:hypothetical protein